MGALLSIPLLAVPSLGTIGGFAASCCGAAACSGLCSLCGKCNSSVGTRIAYALIFLVNAILSWLMLTPWALQKLEGLTLGYMHMTCDGEKCHGFVAVQRINLALGLWHILLAVLLMGVNSSRNPRAGIQNGFWGPKIIGWLLMIVVMFFIPQGFFTTWGNYFALILGSLFLLLGLVLLIELVHSWAEYCLDKIQATDSSVWRGILIGSTLSMYIASIALTIVMYIFFAHGSCSMNISWVTINLFFLLGVSAISINPTVQEYNSRAGLAQSAMVAAYCTYLCMSAVSMEPDDKQCNPLLRARGARTASIVLGAIFTMLTIAYTTTRAATQGLTGGGHHADSARMGAYARLQEVEAGAVNSEQPTRREMRRQAIQSAVDQGVLPASALDDDSDDDLSDDDYVAGGSGKDDERRETQYSYALFHIIFFLATQYTATLLTMNIDEVAGTGSGDFMPVGRTYFASWLKIVSSWVCYGLYTWSLVAPVLMPDRFGYF